MFNFMACNISIHLEQHNKLNLVITSKNVFFGKKVHKYRKSSLVMSNSG